MSRNGDLHYFVTSKPDNELEWYSAVGKRCEVTLKINGKETMYHGTLRKVNPTCTLARIKVEERGMIDVPIEYVTHKKLGL